MDPRFTATFFTQESAFEQPELNVNFPLPPSLEAIPVFLAPNNPNGILFRLGARELIHQFVYWIERAWRSEASIIRQLKNEAEGFIEKLSYQGNLNAYNEKVFAPYRYGFPYFTAVLKLLNSPHINLDIRKNIAFMLASDLNKCLPGFYTRTLTAYHQLTTDPKTSLMAIRRAVAEEILLEMIQEKQILAENVGSEIHYVNSVTNHTAHLFGFEKIEDPYALTIARPHNSGAIFFALWDIAQEFEVRFPTELTLEIVLKLLVQKLLPTLRDILKSEQTSDEKNVAIDTLLIPYGVDCYYDQYTFYDSNTYELRNEPDIELQLTISMIERLKQAGLITLSYTTCALTQHDTLYKSQHISGAAHFIITNNKGKLTRTDLITYLLDTIPQEEMSLSHLEILFLHENDAGFIASFFESLNAKKAYVEAPAICNAFLQSPDASLFMRLMHSLDSRSLAIFLEHVDAEELIRFFNISMDEPSALELYKKLNLTLDAETNSNALSKLMLPLFSCFHSTLSPLERVTTRSKHTTLQIAVCLFESDTPDMDDPYIEIIKTLLLTAKQTNKNVAKKIALKRKKWFLAREVFQEHLSTLILMAAKYNDWASLKTLLEPQHNDHWLEAILAEFNKSKLFDYNYHLASLLSYYSETVDPHQFTADNPRHIKIACYPTHFDSIFNLIAAGKIPQHHYLDFSACSLSSNLTNHLLNALSQPNASTYLTLKLHFHNLDHDMYLFQFFIDRGTCPQGLQLHFTGQEVSPFTLREIGKFVSRPKTPIGFGIHFPYHLPHDGLMMLVNTVITHLEYSPGPDNLVLNFSHNPLNHNAIRALSRFISSGRAPKGLKLVLRDMHLDTEAYQSLAAAIKSGSAPSHFVLDIANNLLTNEQLELFEDAIRSGKAPAYFNCEFPERNKRLMEPINKVKKLIEQYAFKQLEEDFIKLDHFMDLDEELHDQLVNHIHDSIFASTRIKMKWLTERFTVGFTKKDIPENIKTLAQIDYYSLSQSLLAQDPSLPECDDLTTYCLASQQLNLLSTQEEWQALREQLIELKPNVLRFRLFNRNSLTQKIDYVLHPDFFTTRHLESKLTTIALFLTDPDIGDHGKLGPLFESIQRAIIKLQHTETTKILQLKSIIRVMP